MKKGIIILVCVLCVCSGFAVGFVYNSEHQNSEIESTTDISNASSQSALSSDIVEDETSSVETETNSEEKNDYPFELYHSFLTNSSEKTVEALNNNPIDEEYYKYYISAKSSDEEQKILSGWISAYEKEFENAKSVFERSLNEKSVDNDTSKEDIMNITEKYIECCSEYTEATAQLAYTFEEFNLGKGTNHNYSLLLNSLEIGRTNTLHLIECIYMLDGDYTWSK